MSLPQPSPLHVEIAPDSNPSDPSTWNWEDVTSDRLESSPVAISGGRRDESSRVAATKCTLKLNNRAGKYANRNPLSEYYTQLRQNTPLRVRWGDYVPQVQLLGMSSRNQLDTPNNAQFHVTGNCEVRWLAFVESGYLQLEDTGSSEPDFIIIAGRYEIDGDNRSWVARWMANGHMRFTWSPDGTFGALTDLESTEPFPTGYVYAGRMAIQMDDGAGNRRADFYTGPSLDGPWTPLGDPVIETGTSQIHAGNDNLTIGWSTDRPSGAWPMHGFVRGFQLWDGIEGSGGTVVADPGIANQTPDSLSWTGPDGLPWSLSGTAYLDDASTRHVGYVAEWPTRWDQSGNDSWVPISAPGILRRMQQGRQKLLRSPLFRDMMSPDALSQHVAYWPCEDGQDSSRVASPIEGVESMKVSGDVEFAQDSPVVGSEPFLVLNNGSITANVPEYEETDEVSVGFIWYIRESLNDNTLLLRLRTNGTAARHDYVYHTNNGGVIEVEAYDSDGNLVDVSGLALNGRFGAGRTFAMICNIERGLDTSDTWGGHRSREIFSDGTAEAGYTSSLVSMSPDTTTGRLLSVEFGDGIGAAGIGHISVWPADNAFDVVDQLPTFDSDINGPITGYRGELAGNRFLRLCIEEGIRLTVRGTIPMTSPMGPQRPATLLELLRECEAAEVGGVMHEHAGGLALTTRASRYTQASALDLVAASGQLALPPEPTDDDQLIVNDFTAVRREGSSARVVDETHVARFDVYDDSRTLNVERDNQLEGLAAWRVHLGTVDEYRWPVISIRLHHDPDLIDDWLALLLGNRITVAGAWEQLPGIDIDLLVEGWAERISLFEWRVDMNCVPASPWRVAVVGGEDHEESIIDTDGSELDSSFEAGVDTSMSVATTRGPLWSTTGEDYPLDIQCSGVVLRVTAVSGSSSPQTFTVEQEPVNGVEKTLDSGTDLRLASPFYIGL